MVLFRLHFSALLKACNLCEDVHLGMQIHGQIVSVVGFDYNMCSDAELFDGLPVKDIVAWTAIVMGYAQNSHPKEALNLFKRMKDADVETDEVYVSWGYFCMCSIGCC